jgi:hypothetical protein
MQFSLRILINHWLSHCVCLPLLQSIPRTVAVDSKTGVNLIQWPIEEVESLRTNKQVQTGLKLDASALVKVDGTAGSQVSSMD